MIEIPSKGVPIKAWVDGVPVEEEARVQLQNIAMLPVVHPHLAVMPDVHLGKGATVGSVVPTRGAIIPAAVGVDIGCGMMAVRTNLTAEDLPDSLAELRSAIESVVPHGRTNNGGFGDKGAWNNAPPLVVENTWNDLKEEYSTLVSKHPWMLAYNTFNHLGTLGTGNHFVEVCLDAEGRVWVMLHSGSRGVGNKIGSYFIELAKEDMLKAHGNLPMDHDLAYLTEGTDHFSDYVESVGWAQKYAHRNREIMMARTLNAVQATLRHPVYEDQMAVNCHHNFVQEELHDVDGPAGKEIERLWITRKGAVEAQVGQLGIIPGSMGAKSFIVRGKGNAESFNSCSHGAGRKMSRNQAKKTFTLEDHAKATAGIECRKDEGVIDETPGCYKDIDAVMSAQSDLVEIVATLRQVLCIKG
jgi:tRNA-splicing ligase RtcB